MQAALGDLFQGALHWPQWLTLANYDVLLRFRRSVLGPLWITISFAITIAALGLVYRRVLHEDLKDYLPYLAVGLILWNFISQTLQEGCDAFIADLAVLRQTYVPRSTCVYRVLWRNLLVLAMNATVIPVVFLLSGLTIGPAILWAVPGLALLLLNLAWLTFALALVSTRFRDVPRLVASILQLSLFITPVIWRAGMSGDLRALTIWNPLHHVIEIVRAPILGQMPEALSWIAASALAVIGCALTAMLFARYRWRITYWL